MRKKHGIFSQFLLSYLCVLLPVLMLNLWMVNVMRNDRQMELYERLQKQLAYVGEQLDDRVERYSKSAVSLANDTTLLRTKMLGSVEGTRLGLETLEKIQSYFSEAQHIFMAYGDGFAYEGAGKTRLDAFCDAMLSLSAQTRERFVAAIESEEVSVQIFEDKTNNAWVLFHYPERKYRGDEKVSVNYLLRKTQLMETMRQFLSMDIVGLSLNTQENDTDAQQTNPVCTVLTMNTEYFSLHLYYDENTLWAHEQMQWRIWYIAIALLMIALTTLSIVFSRRHYRPIQHLAERAKNVSNLPTKKPQNEYDYVDTFMRHMILEGKCLKKQLERERAMVRQQSATLILKGIVCTREQILARLDFCGIVLATEHYAVMAIQWDDAHSLENVQKRASAYLYAEMECAQGKEILVFIAMRTKDDDGEERKAYVHQLCADDVLRVSISAVYDDLELIVQARMEAEQGLKRAEYGGAAVLSEDKNRVQIGLALDTLDKALHANDSERAIEKLRQMQANCRTDTERMSVQECARNTILSVLVTLGQDEDKRIDDMLQAVRENIPQGMADGWTALEGIIREMCAGGNKSDIVEKALSYIREHYSSSALSLEMVAEHCGVSAAYMSRLFKHNMGIGYIDYITELRMAEARRILLESKQTISEVALRVGYLDVSNFRKKFRQVMGISITELRKENRKDE